MPDDWGDWVSTLDVDELIKYADAWMREEMSILSPVEGETK